MIGMEFISHSPDETEVFGEALARRARVGLVIALSGDLGAGKTRLVKGFARGLGASGRVHSPTFTLANEYEDGRLKLFHIDLYRLDTPEQLGSAGLDEFLEPEGISVIEWAERIEHWWPSIPDLIKVRLEIISENERKIIYDDIGA
jgi:tRNA threonylcarbamoyladenosine biosynthesis protein TsaE